MTTVVKCQTSDSKIWNLEKFCIELALAATKGDVIIDLNTEGPCCESIGLTAIIDLLVNEHGFDRNQFSIIHTGNQVPSIDLKIARMHQGGQFVKMFFQRPVENIPSTLEKRFGLFIGRSNWIRLGLASYLWTHHRDQSEITFHYDNTVDFHRANFGLEQFVQRHYNEKNNVLDFLDAVPLKHEQIDQYPLPMGIQDVTLIHTMAPLYKKIFCEIICETYFSGKTFHITEKTFRPLLFRRPFIVQGPKYFLENLHRLGFKTFSNWWDEGYDQDHHDSRYETITNNIEWIASQNASTIANWYEEMQPILEHNYQTAMALIDPKVVSTDFCHD